MRDDITVAGTPTVFGSPRVELLEIIQHLRSRRDLGLAQSALQLLQHSLDVGDRDLLPVQARLADAAAGLCLERCLNTC